MVFSSLVFLFLFLPAFLIVYFFFKKRTHRNLILLLFSLLFYAWGEPIYILLMIASIGINYYMAILLDKLDKDKQKRKKTFILAIVINILLLVVFKYLDFLIETINLLPQVNIPLTNIALPIGISFYTFQIMSYIIAVYQRKVKVQKSIIYLGCYITAFPQLIAGPIVRYEDVDNEIEERNESFSLFAEGIRRFLIGLGKKAILADLLSYVAMTIFAGTTKDYGLIGSWIGMLSYTMQIYYDFSGYSDMAIGLGKMFGFNYLENFNYPYIAKNVTEFWRRWHISLSSFFRDYVYIPLGGNRVSKSKNIRNILIVWLLTGAWHGASWNFLLWGLFFGIVLLIEKFLLKEKLAKAPNILQHLYTMGLVVISWVIFRCNSLLEIKDILTSLIGINGLGNIDFLRYHQVLQIKYILAFILGVIFVVPMKPMLDEKFKKNEIYQTIMDVLVIGIFIVAIMVIVTGTYSPFIYFRF